MNFKEYKLCELSNNITDGVHNTVINDDNGDCYLLSCKNIKNGKVIIGENERKINKQTLEKLRKRTLMEKDDILITSVGTIGEMSIVEENDPKFEFQRSVAIIKPNKQIVIPRYLYYVLKNEKTQVESLVKGAVQKCLFLGDIKNIKVKIPEIEEQIKVANILSNIDKKIEINNAINDNLSKVSQLLCDNFVKNSSIRYCKIKELNPKLETGKRPNGGINNIISGIPSIGAESIKGLGYFDYSKTKYVTEEYFDKMKKGIIQGYELLIYKDGGKPGYFMPNFSMFGDGFPYEKSAINEHVFLLDFNNVRFNIFSYYYFNSEKIRHKLHVLGSKSAAIPGINQQDILNLEIPNIKNDDDKELLDILESNTREIIKNSKQNFILSKLRDLLLPKLMNGEIDLDKIEI